jgi:hypothetical protein
MIMPSISLFRSTLNVLFPDADAAMVAFDVRLNWTNTGFTDSALALHGSNIPEA